MNRTLIVKVSNRYFGDRKIAHNNLYEYELFVGALADYFDANVLLEIRAAFLAAIISIVNLLNCFIFGNTEKLTVFC